MAVAKRRHAKRIRPKATTFRLDPPLQEGLVLLGRVLGRPLNGLVNEAVRGFVEKRSAEVEADLEETLRRVKTYRKRDPSFESAIAEFVGAEATQAAKDPVEGRPKSSTGPSQRMVRRLLRA